MMLVVLIRFCPMIWILDIGNKLLLQKLTPMALQYMRLGMGVVIISVAFGFHSAQGATCEFSAKSKTKNGNQKNQSRISKNPAFMRGWGHFATKISDCRKSKISLKCANKSKNMNIALVSAKTIKINQRTKEGRRETCPFPLWCRYCPPTGDYSTSSVLIASRRDNRPSTNNVPINPVSPDMACNSRKVRRVMPPRSMSQ